MLKSFCNKCGAPAAKTTARFDSLVKVSNDSFGIEIALIGEGDQRHICDECLAEMLFAAALTFEDSKIVQRHHEAVTDAMEYNKRKVRLDDRDERLARRERDLQVKLDAYAEDKTRSEKESEAASKQIAVLTTQLGVLKNDMDARIKREVAAREQAKIDEVDNPRYTANVARREQVRLGGRTR